MLFVYKYDFNIQKKGKYFFSIRFYVDNNYLIYLCIIILI